MTAPIQPDGSFEVHPKTKTTPASLDILPWGYFSPPPPYALYNKLTTDKFKLRQGSENSQGTRVAESHSRSFSLEILEASNPNLCCSSVTPFPVGSFPREDSLKVGLGWGGLEMRSTLTAKVKDL